MKESLVQRLHMLSHRDSLQFKLLARSLLILGVLLALIGTTQYFVMRNIVYSNKAESLHSQVLAVPPMQLASDFPMEFVVPDYINEMKNNAEKPSPGTISVNNGILGPEDINGNMPGELPGQLETDKLHPRFLIPETSMAYIDSQGNFYELNQDQNGSTAPRLEAAAYQAANDRQPSNDYLLVDNNNKQELVVLVSSPGGPERQGGIIQISTPTGPLDEMIMRQLLAFLGLALAAMVMGLISYLPVIQKTLAPLSNMVEISEQIDTGNLDRRFPTRQGQAEIDQLAESFNGMMERLEASFEMEKETKEQMRRFIADASHELRTPLTSIHGFVEVLLRGAAEQPEQLDKSLKSMLGESQRMRTLVQDLIVLTRLDSAPHIEFSRGELAEVLSEMEPQLEILAGRRQLSIETESSLLCRYNSDQMKQVILNLVQNAVQHTDAEQGSIEISLKQSDTGVLLAVCDNGPGISEEHIPHVFDRFYRSDSSRARKHGGSGLGLAITRSIVEMHGGSIWVECQDNSGCCFYVRLPA